MRNIFFVVLVIGTLATSPAFSATEGLSDSQEKLCNAIVKGEIEIVKGVLEKEPELANTIYGNTGPKPFPRSVLFLAVEKEQPEIAKLLLVKGADPKINFCNTPWQGDSLKVAVYHSYLDLIPLLVERGCNPSLAIRVVPFAEKERGGDAAILMKTLIDNGADVNYRNEANSTPLHEIAFGDAKIAEILISNGADINAKNSNGQTPLYRASGSCNVEVVKLLLAHNADVNVIDRNKKTPLENLMTERMTTRDTSEKPECYATIKILIANGSHFTAADLVYAGDLERLKKLLQENPKQILAKDCREDPLLFCAIRQGHTEIADYLIQQGADVNAVGTYGDPALHAAVRAGNIVTVKLLLRQGFDVNRKGKYGELALHWAAGRHISENNDKEDSYDKIAKMLIEAGSSLNIPAQKGQPDSLFGTDEEPKPIDWVGERLKWVQIVQQGSQTYQWPWDTFGVGDTPLHSAAQSGRINIGGSLIEAKAEIDYKNSHGQTPLHYAITFKYPRIVECLLKAGADPKVKMNDGTTAIELANKVNDKQIIDLLKTR